MISCIRITGLPHSQQAFFNVKNYFQFIQLSYKFVQAPQNHPYMKKLYSSVLFVLLMAGTCFTQEYQEILRDVFYEGEFFLMEESYVDALGEYQKLLTRGHADNANVNYRIGVCYLNIPGEKEKAIPYLEKAVKNVTGKYREGVWKETQAPQDAWLYLGNAYRITEQLDKACMCYETYQDLLGEETSEMHAYTGKQIQACSNAREAMKNPVFYIRTHTGEMINTSRSDFNPVVSADEEVMVYMTSLAFYDALMMSRKKDGEWTGPVNITPEIQSDGDQYASFLTPDGTGLYLTKEDEFNSDIYYSDYEDGRWTKSKPLGKLINTKYWESHASVDAEGETLYLASNRKDSYGGTDIYVSRKNALGIWDEPVNLGQGINTELNEDHPFISEDGKVLYFASQGHYNIGGYDIFYSERLADGSWGEPKNLGYPVNTTDDDLFFFPSGNGKYGYQALFDDENTGSSDIYRFQLFETEQEYQTALAPPEELVPEEPEIKETLTEEIEEVAPVEESVEPEAPAVPETPARTYVLRPVFFDFDSFSLKADAKTRLDELARIMEALPVIEVEANGHTDSKGPDGYNMMLAKKRAASAVQYLVSKGIDSKRLRAISKGESQPVALNENADGSDSPEGRKLNRRVEFRVIKPDLPNVKTEEIQVPENLRK